MCLSNSNYKSHWHGRYCFWNLFSVIAPGQSLNVWTGRLSCLTETIDLRDVTDLIISFMLYSNIIKYFFRMSGMSIEKKDREKDSIYIVLNSVERPGNIHKPILSIFRVCDVEIKQNGLKAVDILLILILLCNLYDKSCIWEW